LDADVDWSTEGVDGARRFLDRVWRLIVDEDGSISSKIVDTNNGALDKVYHETIKKVTEDYENLHFNTAISQMMVFVNEAYKVDKLDKSHIEGFIKVLAPIAPHMCEELWSVLGHDGTIAYEAWPTYDESFLVEDEVEIVVQVMGRVRSKISVPKDISKDELEKTALSDEKIQEWIEGKNIMK